ncbi:hypothetical protein Q0590_33915 [Rhodocytophaga aerolata]|uniref:Uncharacterized protein n=1 Tax=Rhodocytophaga aerolata TaxID=455078 RepID=A0ABT8RGU4_9BACT|nr:hypothetical protein [Rhodocytophaga aerolata]MDO1451321.1 hypothetical protein [Rhodocytophaga aerolata]
MNQDPRWVVEYSVDKKEFVIKEGKTDYEHTFFDSRHEKSTSYKHIGLFANKQLASFFCENLQQKLSEKEEKTQEEQAFPLISKACDQTLSYELVVGLLDAEFSTKPEGYLGRFCQEHALSLTQLSSLLKNPSYCLDAALLVAGVLTCLNYVVTTTAVMVFEEKDLDEGEIELRYSFTKKPKEESFLAFLASTNKSSP